LVGKHGDHNGWELEALQGCSVAKRCLRGAGLSWTHWRADGTVDRETRGAGDYRRFLATAISQFRKIFLVREKRFGWMFYFG